MDNSYYLLALNRIKQMGPITIQRLLRHWPCLHDLFTSNKLSLQAQGISANHAEAITSFDFKPVEADLRWQAADNHHLITWADDNYPPLLKEIHDSPPVLYGKGRLEALQQACVAMVGTRKPSMMGKETAQTFAYQLASKQITIVSGLALGIDANAHRGCLRADGLTIAVMGTGINRIYPSAHRYLADEISEKGLLISEFPPESSAMAGHFPRRNRIISGLSLITLVVEAAVKSGSLITARLALEQNRDVLAVPGSLHNPQARGCHLLLQQGAKLVTSCEDILDELPKEYFDERAQYANVGSLSVNLLQDDLVKKSKQLALAAQTLVECVEPHATPIDQIVARSGLVFETVLCLLAELEMQGIVHAVPGGYMRCLL